MFLSARSSGLLICGIVLILFLSLLLPLVTAAPPDALAKQKPGAGRCLDGSCFQSAEDRQKLSQPVDLPASNQSAIPAGPSPYYFIAVHNEPYHGDIGQSKKLAKAYFVLKDMVAQADRYGIRLTLMFSPPWGALIASDPAKVADLNRWAATGHEIALHHHSIYHGGWDGYTDYTPQEAETERLKHTKTPEPYLGTLDNMVAALVPLSGDIRSGCSNDEQDKAELPDSIVYDTCSGFLNTGTPGVFVSGQGGGKGINDFIIVGNVSGIERRWVSHRMISTAALEREAELEFSQTDSNSVFGAITHSATDQAPSTYQFLEFIHAWDPDGSHSLNLTEVFQRNIIPEVKISDEIINSHQSGKQPRYDETVSDGCDTC
ncbi:MAG TPA: hypothetical protein VN372_00840 [Methanospirillum sp.]|nr:hypothetical protein [Methanospirillum sp.]